MDTTRSTNSNTSIREHNFIIPADIVMDVLQVVFNYGVSYQIVEVNSDDGHLKLNVNTKGQPLHYSKAVENIEVLLVEYKDFERSCDIR